MDERKIEPPPQRTLVSGEPTSLDSRLVSINGTEVRIDAAHASSTIGQASASSAPAELSIPAESGPSSSLRASSSLQRETGRIFEQIQLQLAQLTEREASFEERLAAFEDEQHRYQSRRAAEEADLHDRRSKLESDEAELVQRLMDARSLLSQLESARQAVEMERVDLESRRASLREDLLAELQQDRQSADEAGRQAAQELERAQAMTSILEERMRAAEAEAGRLIQGERERLWQTLIAEWEDRRTQFQQEHDAWVATVQAERFEIEREKAICEAAVRKTETEFDEAREAQEAELEARHNEHLKTLLAERAEWEQFLAAQQAEWQAEKGRQIVAIEAERNETITELQSEWATLEAEQEEWNKSRSIQIAEIEGERAILEKRIRFQQEHLEKLRSDLEKAQNEHRRERQIEQQRLEDDNIQIQRRMRQIDLYRTSIDERERSLERERDVLEKSRRALSSSVDMDRLNLQREQSAWQAERQIQQGELLRQQELYSSHIDGLESRRIRLEKLRTELEDTHRSTLEMRLAVEEAWVELTHSAGQDVARERVEQVRNTLVGYYRQLHEGLVDQRREHLEAQTRFERLRAEFHDERQKLMEWIASRDQELRVGEERLRLATADAAMRDSTWQVSRDRWMLEKAEAEQVIRKLLVELGERHRDPSLSMPSLAELEIASPGIPAIAPGSIDSND